MRSGLLLFLTVIVLAAFAVSVYLLLCVPSDPNTKQTPANNDTGSKTISEKDGTPQDDSEIPVQTKDNSAEKPTLEDLLPSPHGFDSPEWIRPGVIGIAFASPERTDISRSREAAEELAKDIHKKITSDNLPFREAAKKFSDHQSAEKGGDLGFVRVKDIANLPGSSLAADLEQKTVSSIVEGKTGFFIYTRIPYEALYAKIRTFPYGDVEGKTVSKGKARSYAYKLYNSISKDWNPFSGPEGYVGEVLPGITGKKLYTMVSVLQPDEISAPFDTGTSYAVIKRCLPIQFTFSYIVFPGETDSDKKKHALLSEAEKYAAKIKSSKDAFYEFALSHHKRLKWDAPWYKVSKDLFTNRISRPVYTFLSGAEPGDISKPLIFSNGVYILMKEPFIKRK